jgi:hypothetical protein
MNWMQMDIAMVRNFDIASIFMVVDVEVIERVLVVEYIVHWNDRIGNGNCTMR